MTPVYSYLANGALPSDQKEAAVVRRRAWAYVILDSNLYRRGFSIPLLKYVEEDKVDYILRAKYTRGSVLNTLEEDPSPEKLFEQDTTG
ncbi:hypothetical protein A2U01_0069451, partial [Trifolium medium]|nr:hypothetical protein [Trifolium medium]